MKQKHKEFADEYLANGYKPREAYMKVYVGTSKETASVNAYRVLHRDDVKEYVDERRKELFEARMVDATRWANEVADIAFAKKGDEVYTPADKLKALQMLQKYLGLDVQKVEQKQEVIEVSLVED